MRLLVSVDAPHFCAGLVITDDVVTEAAPILKYMLGWNTERVRGYIRKKGWKATQRRIEERG